MMMILAMNGVV